MKKFLACSLIAMLACGALLAGCGGDKKDEAAAGKTKAAFVYVSSAKDGGYSMAHELGRQYVAKNMPDVETSFMESVPEGRSTSRKNPPTLPSCTAPVLKPRPMSALTLAACMKRAT